MVALMPILNSVGVLIDTYRILRTAYRAVEWAF